MAEIPGSDRKWVLVQLGMAFYGIPADAVREMLLVPPVTRVPRLPEHVRGVINLRGSVMPLVDLKTRLGGRSALDELRDLLDLLEARERDHRNWLETLENSVRERKPFTGQLDPHKCAFGLWYDAFTTDNAFLSRVLRQFDEPHKRIHRIGERVREFEARDDHDGAIRLIEEARHKDLATLVRLFGETRDTLREYHREVAVVVEVGAARLAMTVDQAVAVENPDAATFEALEMGALHDARNEIVPSVARRAGSDGVILLLDAGRLAAEYSGAV